MQVRARDQLQSWTLGTFRGIAIRLHVTLVLALPYFAILIASRFSESARLSVPAWVWGLAMSIGLFVSVAIHECAHALTAQRYGFKVSSITLLIFGGVSQMTSKSAQDGSQDGYRHEGVIALMGPAASAAIALLCFASLKLGLFSWPSAQVSLSYLAQMNGTLALFNLLPAFPLDGGRILRAMASRKMGFERGTQFATTVGVTLAILMIFLGVVTLNFLLALIGAFVYGGALLESRRVELREKLLGLKAHDFMHASPPHKTLDANLSIEAALKKMSPLSPILPILNDEHWIVVSGRQSSRRGHAVGVIDQKALLKVPEAERKALSVVLVANLDMPHVTDTTPAVDVLDLLADGRSDVAVEDSEGELEGVINEKDFLEFFERVA